MELNSNMSYTKKIILLAICTSLGAEMLPDNGAELNYTQVFFRWDQIPNAESYQFTLQNMETGEELELNGGKVQVPCLRIDSAGEVSWLYESNDIINYLEKHF